MPPETAWFERGDGARFEVPLDSEAYANLVAQGAIRISGPAAPSAASDAPPKATVAELKARAAELGLEIPSKAKRDEIAALVTAEETRLAEAASAKSEPEDEGA